MSFTTDIFNSIVEDMRSKPIVDTKSTAMRLITYSNMLQVAFAVSKGSGLRAIYLSVGNIASKVTFPKWKGVSIELAKIPEYGIDKLFIAMRELPGSVSYIFEIVAEDLRKTHEEVKDSSLAYAAVSEVLAKWKNFFQYDGEVLLSDIRQQGLMGELYFLKEAIEKIGAYSVAKWAGSNDETHDFYFNDHAVEVKTTSTKEPYKAHISSEYQLDVTDVAGNLYLIFYALRKSQSAGVTLSQMVNTIRDMLIDNPAMQMQFTDKLHKYGFFDEVAELYTTGYYIRDEYVFGVGEGFPCVVSGMLNKGISNVEYSIGIDHCLDYTINKNDLFEELRGGAEGA
jgi:hypothetical protein